MTLKGIDAMVAAAVGAAGRSREPVVYVTYFLDAWREVANLPTSPPPGSGIPVLHAVPRDPRPSTTDRAVAQAYAVAQELKREMGME